MQLVVDFGGKVNGGVNKETNFLVMGDLDYSKTVTGEKSSKIIKAETLKLKGQDIEIIPEEVFYDMFEMIKNTETFKIEKNAYNKAKSFIILASNQHSFESIKEIFSYNMDSTFTIDEKITIFNECLEDRLVQKEEIRETQYNYFSKLKVAELQNILQENKLENSEKTKKVLIDRILENINLNEYAIESVYKWTNVGIKFRDSLN